MPHFSRSVAAAAAGTAVMGRMASATCPSGLNPYSAETNPFGWPVTPSDFTYDHPECWVNKYATCGGTMQSPMDLDLNLQGTGCSPVEYGSSGNLASKASYNIMSGRPTMTISSYMRAVSLNGTLGTLTLQDANGADVEYEATTALLTAGGTHMLNGVAADAELLIVHKPKKGSDPFLGRVVLSVNFKESSTLSSDLFDQMGFTDGIETETGEWRAPKSVDLAAVTEEGLGGRTLSYYGSMPAPPCLENVKYIIPAKTMEVSATQLANLKSALSQYTGGTYKREAVSRQASDGTCRKIELNSLLAPTTALTSSLQCTKSPVDIVAASTNKTLAATSATTMFQYNVTKSVQAVPSNTSLDFDGEFGSILINGRLFEAKKLSLKAVTQHSYNGKRYAAELVVEHRLYGDDLTIADDIAEAAAEHSAEATTTTAAAHASTAEESAHRRLSTSETTTNDSSDSHKVLLSIPFTLGSESALLRTLGLGNSEHKTAVEHGNGYDITTNVDLASGIAASTSGNWYWYSGGPTTAGACPDWGVRWMVFETPLTMSLAQLQTLALPVSGIDSTVPPQSMAQSDISYSSVPANGVEDGSCNENDHYLSTNCWAKDDAICGAGEAQSPINVITSMAEGTSEPDFLAKCSWKPLKGVLLENDGYKLGACMTQFGYTTIIGDDGFTDYYQITDVSLRMPSEHMLNGKQYPAELQVVQKNQQTVLEYDDADVIVSSIFFEFGEENKLLKQFLPDELPAVGETVEIEHPIDLQWGLGPALDGNYYKYDGSYTMPGCEEVVRWAIFETPLQMSAAQWNAFQAVFPHGNNRPVQELNSRTILKNSMGEGTPAEYEHFLNREMGRNKRNPPIGYIAFPIIGTILLCFTAMFGIFQREDKARKMSSAGGLNQGQTIGKGYDKL
mmetsp:Transcript_13844/g.30519  ORF Transcript_13844/g.30519 Transcript_13844/m.30519 type:complete len:904 (+) Transcript_13844:124-2835(+)